MVVRLIAAADGDKDGKVSFAEFTASHKKRFDDLDANKDGSIDEAERKQAAEKMSERMKKAREKMRGGRDKQRSKPEGPKAPPSGQSGSAEIPTEVPPPEPA